MLTLAQYRDTNHFDIPELAKETGLAEDIIYSALVNIPIPAEFASKIQRTLSTTVKINTFVPALGGRQSFHTHRVYCNVTIKEIAEATGFTIGLVNLLDMYNEATIEAFPVLCKALTTIVNNPELDALFLPCNFVTTPDLAKVRRVGKA